MQIDLNIVEWAELLSEKPKNRYEITIRDPDLILDSDLFDDIKDGDGDYGQHLAEDIKHGKELDFDFENRTNIITIHFCSQFWDSTKLQSLTSDLTSNNYVYSIINVDDEPKKME
jgi:hypothetical protein